MCFTINLVIFIKKIRMNFEFEILKKNRELILKVVEGLSIEQLNKIPEGFNNNIVWNIAHLVVTQQLLCYTFSGLPVSISDKLLNSFRKGTAPVDEVSLEEYEEIKKLFSQLPTQLESDYNAGIFKSYQEYTTSVAITLKDIDSAIAFNNLHEGIHLGVILGLKKLL